MEPADSGENDPLPLRLRKLGLRNRKKGKLKVRFFAMTCFISVCSFQLSISVNGYSIYSDQIISDKQNYI
jgi:hypothetical protein